MNPSPQVKSRLPVLLSLTPDTEPFASVDSWLHCLLHSPYYNTTIPSKLFKIIYEFSLCYSQQLEKWIEYRVTEKTLKQPKSNWGHRAHWRSIATAVLPPRWDVLKAAAAFPSYLNSMNKGREEAGRERCFRSYCNTLWYVDSISLPCDKHGVGHKVLQSLLGLFGPFF